MTGEISPGPWHWETWEPEWKPDGSRLLGVMDNQRDFVFDCECESGGLVVKEVDARLIAAAPELLELVEAFLTEWDGPKDHWLGTMEKAYKLVLKIRGDK